jgi:hypothetical protein
MDRDVLVKVTAFPSLVVMYVVVAAMVDEVTRAEVKVVLLVLLVGVVVSRSLVDVVDDGVDVDEELDGVLDGVVDVGVEEVGVGVVEVGEAVVGVLDGGGVDDAGVLDELPVPSCCLFSGMTLGSGSAAAETKAARKRKKSSRL